MAKINWAREELILALDLYVRAGRKQLDQGHPEVRRLSQVLQKLPLHKDKVRDPTFRNVAGVAMKLGNFSVADSSKAGGGLANRNKLEEKIWEEFANDPKKLGEAAAAIRVASGLPANAPVIAAKPTKPSKALADVSKGYLFTWNPAISPWPEGPGLRANVLGGTEAEGRWSCGNTQTLPIGGRAFLLRLGLEPKGVIAAGWITSSVFQAPHWDPKRAAAGEEANYVTLSFDGIAQLEPPLPLAVREFDNPPLSDVDWSPRGSGISLPPKETAALEAAWGKHLGVNSMLGAVDPELRGFEGVVKFQMVKHRSRESALRKEKIRQVKSNHPNGLLVCEVPGCGFNFHDRYGAVGKDFAHVHHLRPLAEAVGPVQTGLDDLAVVCANCHAMIHRGGKNRPMDSLIPD